MLCASIKDQGTRIADGNLFTVNPLRNFQNSRVDASVAKRSETLRKRFGTKHQHRPSSVMFSVRVLKFNKTAIYFVKSCVKIVEVTDFREAKILNNQQQSQ